MWIEETKSGKFRAVERYKHPMTGKTMKAQVIMESDTKANRKKALLQLQQVINDKCSIVEMKRDLTIEELCKLYLDDIKIDLKASTVRKNGFMCKKAQSVWGSDTLVNNLNKMYIVNKLEESDLTAKQSNELIKRFGVVLRWGYKNDYISTVNYLDKIRKLKEEEDPSLFDLDEIEKKYLEADELKALLDGMHHPLWKPVTAFLALSGLRYGEFCSLTQKDVNLDDRMIYVRSTFDPNNKVTTSPKTSSSIRKVFIQDELLVVIGQINALMNIYRELGIKSDLFAFQPSGKNARYDTYRTYLKGEIAKTIEREVMDSPHVLRHTHASLLAENNVDLALISKRLGHSNSTITKRIYIHQTKKRQKEDDDALKGLKML